MEFPQNQQPNTPQPEVRPAGATAVTPTGQKKVTLFSDGTFVESGRILPWLVLAVVIGALTWVVMDAWSRTWQEVEVVQMPVAVRPKPAKRLAIPEGWKPYQVVIDGEEVRLPYRFFYPSDLGDVRERPGGFSYHHGDQMIFATQMFGADTGEEHPFEPTLHLTSGPVVTDLLGPLHGFHRAFTGDDEEYGGVKDGHQVLDSVLAHISTVGFKSFCGELRSGPLDHSDHLVLPSTLKERISDIEKKSNDFKGLYGLSQEVLSCNPNQSDEVVEFSVAIDMPQRWTPGANIVEVRVVGAIKFLPKTSKEYSSFAVTSIVRFGDDYRAPLPESEVARTVSLMVRSFSLVGS